MGKNQKSGYSDSAEILVDDTYGCEGQPHKLTKYDPKTQRWRLRIAVASGRPRFQKLQFKAKNSHFWTKTALEPIQNGRTKEKGGYTPRAA